MKPVSVINRGEHFVTLRATTDRPAEIREALAARDVLHIFKGDQNQAWDAVLANHCLCRAVGDSGAEITLFVQDERLGTGDARLSREWRRAGRSYLLTEDYYRGRAGAVWEHQDVSSGLFFTEAVSPEQFAEAGVNLHRAASLWERHAAEAAADAGWVRALASLGMDLPGNLDRQDRVTGHGPAVNAVELSGMFRRDPAAAIYFALTKTDGLYGVVPAQNDNVTLSSIPAAHPELQAAGRALFRTAVRGALRAAASKAHRRQVRDRARRLAEWANGFLQERPRASVTDFQVGLGRWLTAEIFPSDELELDRASRFTAVTRAELETLRDPAGTLHFFLDLALRHPGAFAETYNDALNRLGYGLQRVRWEARTGRFTPPFFVEFAPRGSGTPVYRYNLELSGSDSTTVRLLNDTAGDLVLQPGRRVGSAHDLFRSLFEGLPRVEEISIVGKAASFAAELQRSPRGLGLPRQGSKYAPMVDYLVGGLRARGVLSQPTGILIRIGLNALDRLGALGELPLRLPRFLQPVFGATATCAALSQRWRGAAAEARELLELLSHLESGRHVHLLKALALNASGGDWEEALRADPRLAALDRDLAAAPAGRERLRRLGCELEPAAVACIQRLTELREALLSARRALTDQAWQAHSGGRLVPDPEQARPLARGLERIDLQLLLLFAAYVRRLWQRAESLPYLNDRPYTLALYLLFGREVFPPICRNVEFDVEYVSPCLLSCPEPAVAAVHCG